MCIDLNSLNPFRKKQIEVKGGDLESPPILSSENIQDVKISEPEPTMNYQSGINLIKQFESFEAEAYPDPLSGHLPITVGYGSTRDLNNQPFKLGDRITEKQAEELLNHQILTKFIPKLEKISYWNEMNAQMRGALLSFAYNLGADFFDSDGFNTITKALKEKRWKDVPIAMLLYVNPGTNVTAGLMRRRKAEGTLWETGLNRLA